MGEVKWKVAAVVCGATFGWLLPVPSGAGADAGVTIAFPGPLVTTEAGGTATFTLVLDDVPADAVTISLSSSNAAEGSVAPAQVTFDATNWSVAQTITVTGQDDGTDDGDVVYSVVTGNTVSADPAYHDLPVPDVSVTNVDDEDTAGVAISPSTPLTVLESRTTATFTVVLTAQPTADVVISHTSSDTTEGTVSPPSSTFTPASWNVPQTITVTGKDDLLDDGDVEFSIVQTATSGDPRYEGLAVDSVAVTTLDNEPPAVLIVPTSPATTTESGGTATYQMQLSSRPSSNVVVNLTSSDTTEAAPTAPQLTFTRNNWNVAQTVTVVGTDDLVDDGDVAYSIVHTLVTSDPRYKTIAVDDVALTNTDDDTAGVRFAPSSGLRANEGTSTQFTVVLLAAPTAPVTVTHASSDPRQGTVSPASTTFDTSDWNVPKPVTIRGISDGVPDGEAIFFVEHLVISDDPVYAALAIPRQRVRSADDGVGATTTSVATTSTTTTPTTETTATTATTSPSATAAIVETTTTVSAPPASVALDDVASRGPAGTTSTTGVLRTNSNLPTTGADVQRLVLTGTCATIAGVIAQLVVRRRSRRA